MAYAFLAGDDALPDHEVDGPIRQRLRLRHEPLRESNKHQCLDFKNGEELEY